MSKIDKDRLAIIEAGMYEPEPPAVRPLHHIHDDIVKHWPSPYYAARPYIEALRHLGPIDGSLGHESARSIVQLFLSNAGSWRGEHARRIKKELREMIGK